jgi:hypothetical protein
VLIMGLYAYNRVMETALLVLATATATIVLVASVILI